MNLINEALARARMRMPAADDAQARQPARRIAMRARRRQARELGNLPEPTNP